MDELSMVDITSERIRQNHNQMWPQYTYLRLFGCMVSQIFDGAIVYQVGSSVDKKEWRDIDVVAILPDDEFQKMFPDDGHSFDWKWQYLCAAISCLGREIVGLPIDFKVQPLTKANQHQGPRNCLVNWPMPERLKTNERKVYDQLMAKLHKTDE